MCVQTCCLAETCKIIFFFFRDAVKVVLLDDKLRMQLVNAFTEDNKLHVSVSISSLLFLCFFLLLCSVWWHSSFGIADAVQLLDKLGLLTGDLPLCACVCVRARVRACVHSGSQTGMTVYMPLL